MLSPLDLTIVIPVLNEEKNLSKCLVAIGENIARDIVIIDSGSTDNTREIALKYNAKTVDFVWNGKFPKKRNWFLSNHTPQTKWVLFLDADEYLTEDFKSEIRKKLLKDDKNGYWLKYNIYFLGNQLKGGYPLKKLALFKVGYGKYEQIEECQWSLLDMEVHEHCLVDGNIGTIQSKIDHHDFKGISHYVNKHNEYSSWEASRLLNTPDNKSRWTWKQHLKYKLIRSIWIGPIYFVGSFFLMGGFRDGARGLAFAILKMSYFTQVNCKIKEFTK